MEVCRTEGADERLVVAGLTWNVVGYTLAQSELFLSLVVLAISS